MPFNTLLDREISYSELVDAGALELYPEADVRTWYGPGAHRTVGELLSVRTHPSRVVWAVMRARVLPPYVLYRVALDLAERYLRRARHRGVYIDFRSRRGLAALGDWLADGVSLGERMVAAVAAGRARTDVADLGDHDASATADIVCAALLDDAEEAFRETFYLYIAGYRTAEDFAWVIERARARIGEVELAAAGVSAAAMAAGGAR
ncbi:hypothetical protein [Dactylosporangium sp. NPDC051541]|uniref:hypothetical protein n=1 Tax=Dactylosporangium sp. NPDC051541 TaxID=3363977 RepID=UPI0037B338F2